MLRLRTDLAVEARELAGDRISGVDYREYSRSGLKVSRLCVKSESARRRLSKEQGTYITIELPSLTDNFSRTDERLKIIGEEIRGLLPVNGMLLVAGLGNEEITPDALGPRTASRVLATRHIRGELARASGLDRLRPVAVLSTGVTGQTGIETGEYISSIVKRIRPAAVVAVDALASRRLERLGTTLQISDTGISPGAGVGNHRVKINSETLGVPVIAVGVPTVVDLRTFAADLLDSGLRDDESRLVSTADRPVIIPREIDLLIDRASRLLAFSLNAAFHDRFDLEELAQLM